MRNKDAHKCTCITFNMKSVEENGSDYFTDISLRALTSATHALRLHLPRLTSYILHLTFYILHLTSYILHLPRLSPLRSLFCTQTADQLRVNVLIKKNICKHSRSCGSSLMSVFNFHKSAQAILNYCMYK